MPCRTLRYEGYEDWPAIRDLSAGRMDVDSGVENVVRGILSDVRANGDLALVNYTRKFDCPDFGVEHLAVGHKRLEQAAAEIPESDAAIIREAIENVRVFHEAQKERSWWTTSPDGTILGQLVRPIDRVGLYVPGGQGGETPLVSSLIMNAVPALIAGVGSIAVISPPRRDGCLNPYILATAFFLGIGEVYALGSAWGIAALAYGTKTIAPVDMLAGPGNVYVATAKRLLMSEVGVDMFAGPSEIAILADSGANPAYLAADMLSQAEHDPFAQAILITDSRDIAEKTLHSLNEQMAKLSRSEIAGKSLRNFGAVVIVPNLKTGIELINLIAPEHLELAVSEPWELIGMIRHAGAIFMGHYTPEPVGDYFAGPNHVLPTMGTARFSSALSVSDFVKHSSVISVSREYIVKNGRKIVRLAELEGLEAHARSVAVRLET